MPREVTTTTTTTPQKGLDRSNVVSPLADPVLSNQKKRNDLDRKTPTMPQGKLDFSGKTDVKLVSTNSFQEGSGKNTTAPNVVRSNYVGAVQPSEPEWVKKYEKIGEQVVVGEGLAPSASMQVRGSSTIVAGGNKVTPADKKPKKKSLKERVMGKPGP